MDLENVTHKISLLKSLEWISEQVRVSVCVIVRVSVCGISSWMQNTVWQGFVGLLCVTAPVWSFIWVLNTTPSRNIRLH